jgi:hypothetical protein
MAKGTFRVTLQAGERAAVDRIKDALGLDKDAALFRFLLRMADRLDRQIHGSAEAIFCEKTPDGVPVDVYRAAQERRAQMSAVAALCEFGTKQAPSLIAQSARHIWGELAAQQAAYQKQYG